VANLGSLPDLRKLKGTRIKAEPGDNHCNGSQYGFRFGDSLTSSYGNGVSSAISSSANTIPKFPDGKIKKKLNEGSCSLTISGKPRKRSQHTRGNKLWEFIRSALRDPKTCPTVVKWEDEREGVFRIVESEKLARLWGEKKNNQKMTYEKLSRAMRTYYEKQILVPVPKTGLYPKKLVYKFGPNAKGWQQTTPSSITPSRPNNADKATKPLKSNVPAPNASFPFRNPGISSLVSAAENGDCDGISSNLLSQVNSAAVAAAASGLMSLADVASRRLASCDEDGDCKDISEAIDVDGHSETGDITGAIEETLEDDEDVFSPVNGYDNEEDLERDTPPALVN